ncbi:ribonuclease H-like domain-containing protein [Tanacetum coccineum]
MQKALEAHGAEVSTEDANHKFLRSLPLAWSNLAMTMRTKPDVDTLSIDDLYNNLKSFEQKSKVWCYRCLITCTPATSSTIFLKKKFFAGVADKLSIPSFAKNLRTGTCFHEDLEQIDRSIGTSSEHSVDPESEILSVPLEVPKINTASNHVRNPDIYCPKRPPAQLSILMLKGIGDLLYEPQQVINWRTLIHISNCDSNKDQLEDFEEFNGGSVTFGGSKGYISGKGRIRVGNLDFDSVSFVKELGHFNLFSISQICDKQHKVLFTETECLVVSSDFKMPDENQILLKVPRHHNMYSFDMKTPSPAKGFACLIAKATSDESKLWHRRLGHINFKNLNKLVKGNLVRGSGYQQKDRKPSQNDKTEHGMEKTVQNQGQSPKMSKSESILKNQQSNQSRN